MKITQHGKHLWKITRLWVINSYFVAEDDGLTLIDTLLPGSASGVLHAAEDIGLPITRITLTHAHGDHAGSLDELSQRLPEAEITFAQRTADFLQGNLTLRPDEPQVKLRGTFFPRSTKPTRVLQPGDMLGSLQVVAAPGHSPDQVAFLDERDGVLIAGDAFQIQGGIAVAGVTQPLFPITALATWHLPTALESAIALRQLKPRRLAVGHGRVLDDPLAEMDKAIQAAEARVNG